MPRYGAGARRLPKDGELVLVQLLARWRATYGSGQSYWQPWAGRHGTWVGRFLIPSHAVGHETKVLAWIGFSTGAGVKVFGTESRVPGLAP